jgi:hypothetical protein
MSREVITDNYLRDLEGRSEENAVTKILTDGFDYRITRVDQTNYMVTCDFDTERINLEIDLGVVSSGSMG